MKNFVVAVIVILLIAGGAWWYMNKVPTSSSAGKLQVALAAQNASGQSGTATLEEVPQELEGVTKNIVRLTIKVKAGDKGASQPAHIHVGSCANLGQPVFPLAPVVDGKSVTDIDTTLEAIKGSSQPLAVNVHKSEAEIGTYVACGEIPVNTTTATSTN